MMCLLPDLTTYLKLVVECQIEGISYLRGFEHVKQLTRLVNSSFICISASAILRHVLLQECLQRTLTDTERESGNLMHSSGRVIVKHAAISNEDVFFMVRCCILSTSWMRALTCTLSERQPLSMSACKITVENRDFPGTTW